MSNGLPEDFVGGGSGFDEADEGFGFFEQGGAVGWGEGGEWAEGEAGGASLFDLPDSGDEAIDEKGGGDAQRGQIHARAVFIRDDAGAFGIGEEEVIELWQEADGRGGVFRQDGEIGQVEEFAALFVTIGLEVGAEGFDDLFEFGEA